MTGLGLFTARGSLLGVWKLSSEYISVVKKTIAPAFTPVIRLKRHHRAGFLCEPETESMQAALGCVFKRSRRDSAAWKAGNVCLLLLAFQGSGGITCKVAPEKPVSDIFRGICTDVLITDSDLSSGSDKRGKCATGQDHLNIRTSIQD